MIFRIFISGSILLWLLYSTPLHAQNQQLELSFEHSLLLLESENRTIRIAEQQIQWAKAERQRLAALWYPSINATGAYVYLANPIEVREPLSRFTEPAKDFVHSILPDDQIISSILDKIGGYTLRFPLAPQNITTIDANLIWPIFTGGKRVYAGRIGRSIISSAEVNREQVSADMQILLVESYFGLRLGQRVVEVREQTFRALERQYQNALKLEQNGMINRSERLFVQVSMDEAKRERDGAIKDLGIAQNALKAVIKLESTADLLPTSPLFINEELPSVLHFKSLVTDNSYAINQLKIQGDMAESELKISRSEYLPDIALFGKQTLYSRGIEKNLMPRSMVGVGFTWNLFDGMAREQKIRQAKIAGHSVELGLEKAADDIAVGIDKFYTQMQNALANVTALNRTIELSRELVRMRRKAFAEGMATSTDVVDAEVMLSKVHVASLLAYYQYDVALINLLSLCGVPMQFQQYISRGKSEHFIFQ